MFITYLTIFHVFIRLYSIHQSCIFIHCHIRPPPLRITIHTTLAKISLRDGTCEYTTNPFHSTQNRSLLLSFFRFEETSQFVHTTRIDFFQALNTP
jgi:hypothetical protein